MAIMGDMRKFPSVEVTGAYKRYGKNVILKGLNMTVPRGVIYGLLGPSGCGKTTLLSAIVGVKSLDAGVIKLSTEDRKDIGYMPQEIALNTEFTLMEVFHYYGTIYGLPKEVIDVRAHMLIEFLQLPPADRFVSTCSGGQQRRISMSVTFLHDPQILILDEPTVGVDPILSDKIWKQFVYMATQQQKTIIITTHYIEEARSANVIGLMRGGVLLAEKSPTALLFEYTSDSLEDVFLKISRKQRNIDDQMNDLTDYPKKQKVILPLQQKEYVSRDRLKAQLIKNYRWTLRNWQISLFVVSIPVLMFVIIGEMKGADDFVWKKHLAVVSEEPPCGSREAIMAVTDERCIPSKLLSCRYTDKLKGKQKIQMYESIELARRAVKHNHAYAVIYFHSNFSVFMMERIMKQARVSKLALENSEMNVWLDMTEYPYAVIAMRDLIDKFIEFVQDVYNDCGFNPKLASFPVNVEQYVFPKYELQHTNIPGYICSLVFYMASTFTSSSIIMESSRGTYERSKIAGLTVLETQIAHVGIQMIVSLVQNALSFYILFNVYDFPIVGSKFLAFFITFESSMLGMTYGFFLASAIPKERDITNAGIAVILTLMLLCGTIWPREGMHWFLKPISHYIPVTASTVAFYDVTLRGYNIFHSSVWWGLLTPIFGMGVCSVLTIITHARKKL